MPSAMWLARTTITAAFQRMYRRINFSICGSPGNHGSRLAGMVLTYGLEMVAGNPTWVSCARSRSFINKKLARSLPCTSSTASKDPTHSSVSVGSMSGS